MNSIRHSEVLLTERQHDLVFETRKTKPRKLLTEGQLNRVTDVILHRYFKRNPETILLDALVHLGIEENPKQYLGKFLKYSAPELLDLAVRYPNRRKRTKH